MAGSRRVGHSVTIRLSEAEGSGKRIILVEALHEFQLPHGPLWLGERVSRFRT